MRILTVEDDAAIREIVVEIVSNVGHEVYEASDVGEGLKMVSMVKPDVVLLDLLLKGHVAVDFIDAARQLMQGKEPVIVIVSAMRGANHIAEAHHTLFLAKPFELEALHALLEKIEKPRTKASGALQNNKRERKPPEEITSRDRSGP